MRFQDTIRVNLSTVTTYRVVKGDDIGAHLRPFFLPPRATTELASRIARASSPVLARTLLATLDQVLCFFGVLAFLVLLDAWLESHGIVCLPQGINTQSP